MDVMPKPIILSELQPPIKANPNAYPRVWSKPEFRDGSRPFEVILESFIDGINRETDPNASQPHNRMLWNEYRGLGGTDVREAIEEIAEEAAKVGQWGIKNTITYIAPGGNKASQFQFRPFWSATDRRFMHECLESGDWIFNYFDRLSFWIKLQPNPDLSQLNTGSGNFYFGTYTRRSDADKSDFETDNGHYYHYYDLPYMGTWHKVIVDWHPNHQRDISPTFDHGELKHPTQEPGFNYFDLLTRFYLQPRAEVAEENVPVVIYYDDFRVYREPYRENVGEIYSLHGGYRASDNRIAIGFNRLKGTPSTDEVEVRYAFESIHKIGWENAALAPGGIFPFGGSGAQNCSSYNTTDIDVGSNPSIFFAIKPVGSDKGFRQIEVELDIGD
jgi:hypothetical protein